MDRRQFIVGAGAAAAIIGFDRLGGRWVAAAEGHGGQFDRVPELEGTLHLDRRTRAGAATDKGNIAYALPAAVLRPRSALDVKKMIDFCRERGIKVATRGQHHTMHGQSLTPGLIVESATLGKVKHVGADHAVVAGGTTWRELLAETLPLGLRPHGIPGYVSLSVGGTLSVGGCPMTSHGGGLGDQIRALEVVTGAGEIIRCSAREEPDLFEAMFGGLGQMGVITEATVDLVPARSMARTYLLHYTDPSDFFADIRTLFDRDELDDVYNVCFPPTSALFVYQIQATIFYDADAPPNDAHLLRGLRHPAIAPMQDRSYWDYATSVDMQVAALQATVQWDSLVKPWYDVWLPDDTVETHVREVVENLTQEDVGSGGFILLFMQRRSKIRRPFYRVPEARGADRVWLFDLATTSMLPIRDPAFIRRMARRNRRLFDRAVELGGIRYPIGQLDFGRADWEHHYGEMWPEFARRKRRYDPANVMTPGAGIF